MDMPVCMGQGVEKVLVFCNISSASRGEGGGLLTDLFSPGPRIIQINRVLTDVLCEKPGELFIPFQEAMGAVYPVGVTFGRSRFRPLKHVIIDKPQIVTNRLYRLIIFGSWILRHTWWTIYLTTRVSLLCFFAHTAAMESSVAVSMAKGAPAPRDFSHYVSRVSKTRKASSIKAFYKYFLMPGIGNLAGGKTIRELQC